MPGGLFASWADGEKASHLPCKQGFGFRDPVGPPRVRGPMAEAPVLGTGRCGFESRRAYENISTRPRWSSGQDARLSPGKSPVRVRYGVLRPYSSMERAPVYEAGSVAGSNPAGATDLPFARAGHAGSPPGCKPDASAVAVRLRPRARSAPALRHGRPGAVRWCGGRPAKLVRASSILACVSTG
jgi:hypothetical protein